jgi:(+)-trans-carveol dehydrogenase
MTEARTTTGRVAGKVALVTGAARGQGRAHAVRLAEEGADIIAIDICREVETSFAPAATPEDLAETVEWVRATGARISAHTTDVRDIDQLQAAVDLGVDRLGRLDVVVANAGIVSMAPVLELTEEQWKEVLDVNLTGVWRTVKAAMPRILQQDEGGSVIVISSTGGQRGYTKLAHYCASKHGVIGLAKVLAQEFAARSVRVNVVCPGVIDTPMNDNPAMARVIRPDLSNPTWPDAAEVLMRGHLLPTPWAEPKDVANAVLWLASDESAMVTGTVINVDLGCLVK